MSDYHDIAYFMLYCRLNSFYINKARTFKVLIWRKFFSPRNNIWIEINKKEIFSLVQKMMKAIFCSTSRESSNIYEDYLFGCSVIVFFTVKTLKLCLQIFILLYIKPISWVDKFFVFTRSSFLWVYETVIFDFINLILKNNSFWRDEIKSVVDDCCFVLEVQSSPGFYYVLRGSWINF